VSSLRPLAKPHALYWIYGPGELVLYIGISRTPRQRLACHKSRNKHTWWPYVVRHELEWFDNYVLAAAAETRELRQHLPPCNPIIPEEDGKHVTVRGGTRVRSWWDATADGGRSMDRVLELALARADKDSKESKQFRIRIHGGAVTGAWVTAPHCPGRHQATRSSASGDGVEPDPCRSD
jgi:predicted GIY-YIG superfamily endonuclease